MHQQTDWVFFIQHFWGAKYVKFVAEVEPIQRVVAHMYKSWTQGGKSMML